MVSHAPTPGPRHGSAAPAAPDVGDNTAQDAPSVGDNAASAAPPAPDNAAQAARLRLVVMRLARRLRSQSASGLSPSLISALASLEHHGPLTLGQLAALEQVKPPSVTRLVATLEGAGLARRETDPADRRVTVLTVTAEGRRTLQKSRTRKTAYLARRLRDFDDTEAATLDDALRLLERLLEND